MNAPNHPPGDGPIVSFEKAVRMGSHTLTAFYGQSGSGKTYSAILYGRGLVGPKGRLGFLDTECGRGRVYADLAGGFDYGELTPPFTPERYIQAIKAAEQAGYDALIIDSASHEWEGIGGITESADSSGQKGLLKWQQPKLRHKRFMQAMLSTRMHLVLCLRAKEKMVQKGNEVVSAGWVAIQEKSFIYEMTAQCFFPYAENGKRGIPVVEKINEDLSAVFPPGEKVSIESGARVAEWVRGGKPVDQAFEAFKVKAEEIASQGGAALKAWWPTLDEQDKIRAQTIGANLRSIAAEADAERQRAEEAARADGPVTFGKLGDNPFQAGAADVTAKPAETKAPDPKGGSEAGKPTSAPADPQPTLLDDKPALKDRADLMGEIYVIPDNDGAALDEWLADPATEESLKALSAEDRKAVMDQVKVKRGDA